MNPINLNGLKMNAVETDPNGVIGEGTIFTFEQTDNKVSAHYVGGKIEQGYLVGLIKGDSLHFRYCQMQTDDQLNGGESHCELSVSAQGLIQIIEHFEWGSRPGGGKNVIQQLPDKTKANTSI